MNNEEDPCPYMSHEKFRRIWEDSSFIHEELLGPADDDSEISSTVYFS